MPELPIDPVPYAEFILRHLMQRVQPEGGTERAVAETEHAIDGDRWFWADDNAKVLEFLAIPALWDRYPDRCVEVLRFIESLCEGPFILRRTGHARLEEISLADGVGRWRHTFMNVGCDLPRGIVTIGMRFHDVRTAANLTLTGNSVHFTHAGKVHILDVEDAIDAWEVRRDGPRLLLSHAGDLHFDADGRRQRLGRIEYRYTVDARSMFVDVEASAELDDGVEISDLHLTVGQDNLSHLENHVHYSEVGVLRPGGTDTIFTAMEPGHTVFDAAGVPYWSLYQRVEMSGFALAIHTLPRDPATMYVLHAVARDRRLLHWAASHHRVRGPLRGGRVTIAERKIITAGGFYDELAENHALLSRHAALPPTQPLDLSISYDYGAEINAFARLHRTLLTRPATPLTAGLVGRTRELFDRYHAVYVQQLVARHAENPAAIFSRPLAFLCFGLTDMAIATGDDRYRQALAEAIAVLRGFAREVTGPDGRTMEAAILMGQVTNLAPFVDCHSAGLLALLRALPVLEDPTLITLIDRALESYRIETVPVDLGDFRKMDTVTVHWTTPEGHRVNPHAYWNFCAGLTLRVFKLLRQSTHQATREILERHRVPIETLETVLRLQVRRALRDRGPATEVLTGLLSGEGNSETQPWVALGIVGDSGDL